MIKIYDLNNSTLTEFSDQASKLNETTRLISKSLFEIDKLTAGDENVNYKSLYYKLFNSISNVITSLEEQQIPSETVSNALRQIQRDAEEKFLDQAESQSAWPKNLES